MKIAIIDMGTNTFNLLIAEVSQNKNFKIIFKDKAGVKLGKGGINQRKISSEAFQRAIDAIDNHLKTIQKYNVGQIFTTATSGVRSTQNGQELVETLEKQFNIKIQIISGDEEAELIYRGVKQTIDFNEHNVLILDIGGGSNEFIIAHKSGLLWKRSFDLGMARLLDRFNPSDPITSHEIAAVENYIDNNLTPLYEAVKKYQPTKLIGCSGTFDSFRAMIMAKNKSIPNHIKKENHYLINLDDYKNLHQELIQSTTEERLKMNGLEIVRVEMIVLASIFVNFILRKLTLKTMIQSNFAIKEGLMDKILNSKI
ncbi:MAG: phosphatase [Bacteroidota bacterium]|nr:phosphatase [Bacteroidota bacterium]